MIACTYDGLLNCEVVNGIIKDEGKLVADSFGLARYECWFILHRPFC